ncbi:MAG TPA: type II secretion system protein N [Anaerolineales bacterium]|nr:type II secretion system protein N [Anaerolineales bacterium]
MGRPFDKAQGRPLRLLNVALGLVAVLIAAVLAKAWVAPATFVSYPAVPRSSQEPAAISFDRPARPPLAQFEVLLEKNPFKQPPPPPQKPARPGSPPAPPVPLPTLVGTILVDDERWAILSDKGKSAIYSIGQEVAGGALTAISGDRVLFKRGDAVSELTLKAPIQPGAAAPSAGPQPMPPPSPPAGASVAPPAPPSPAVIEGPPVGQRTSRSRAERRPLRRLPQQGLVEPSEQVAE